MCAANMFTICRLELSHMLSVSSYSRIVTPPGFWSRILLISWKETHTFTHIYTFTYTHTHIHIYIYIYTHTYIYIYTHSCQLSRFRRVTRDFACFHTHSRHTSNYSRKKRKRKKIRSWAETLSFLFKLPDGTRWRWWRLWLAAPRS